MNVAVLLMGLALGQSAEPEYFPLTNRNIKLPILYKKDRAVIREVLLFVSRDKGATWEQTANAPPTKEAFEYRAPDDGLFWFHLVTVDLKGQKDPVDLTREPPALKVLVDTDVPAIRFTDTRRLGDEVVVQWTVEDRHPDDETTKIYFRPSGSTDSTAWKEVTLPARSRTGVRFNPSQSGAITVKVTTQDLAGTKAEATREVPAAAAVAPVSTSTSLSPTITPTPTPSLDARPSPSGFVSPALPPDFGKPAGPIGPDSTGLGAVPVMPSAPSLAVEPPAPTFTPTPAAPPSMAPAVANVTPPAPTFTPTPTAPVVTPNPMPLVTNTMPAAPVAMTPAPLTAAPASLNTPTAPGLVPIATGHGLMTPTNTPPAPQPAALPEARMPIASSAAPTPTAPVTPAHAYASSAAPAVETVRVMNTLRFDLAYEVEQKGPSGISRVDLWVTRDEGKTWGRWSQHDGRETPIRVALDVHGNRQIEGQYGFRLVPVSGAGLSENAPANGEAPDMRVVVDVTPPVIELYQPFSDTTAADTLVIPWRATDKNFGEEPIGIEWSEQPNGPWKPVLGSPNDVVPVANVVGGVVRRIPNNGRFAWRVPSSLPTHKVYLKVTARDQAGNTSEVVTPGPVLVDLAKPRARIQGIVTVAPLARP